MDYSLHSKFVQSSCQNQIPRAQRVFCQFCPRHRIIIQIYDTGVHFVGVDIFPLSNLYVLLQKWSGSTDAIVFAIRWSYDTSWLHHFEHLSDCYHFSRYIRIYSVRFFYVNYLDKFVDFCEASVTRNATDLRRFTGKKDKINSVC